MISFGLILALWALPQQQNIGMTRRTSKTTQTTQQPQVSTAQVVTTLPIPLDFSKWTLETPDERGQMGVIDSYTLRTYSSQYFHSDGKGAAILTATVGGYPAAGESFVRTDLRQSATWNIGTTHYFNNKLAVEGMDTINKKMMLVQLATGDGKGFSMAIGFDDGKLNLVTRPDGTNGDADINTALGTVQKSQAFTIGIEISPAGIMKVAYNDNVVFISSSSLGGKDYFFKTGAHLETNTAMGETNKAATGVVRILHLETDV
jgi:hypothetical protein